jgi:hypothetical protein
MCEGERERSYPQCWPLRYIGPLHSRHSPRFRLNVSAFAVFTGARRRRVDKRYIAYCLVLNSGTFLVRSRTSNASLHECPGSSCWSESKARPAAPVVAFQFEATNSL